MSYRLVMIVTATVWSLAAAPAAAQLTAPAAVGDSWPTHAWRRSSPEAQGLDSRALADAFDYIRAHRIPIHSLQIVRNGFLVLDAYFWPFQDGELHDLASVTKSVTATLVGIAIGEHRLTGLSEPMLAVLDSPTVANMGGSKNRITIQHLLTMTSGLDCHFAQGEITLRQMIHSPDWVRFMLDLPMAAEPGRHFEYCSGGTHVLSAAVARVAGMSTLDFARRELFGPLGIEDVVWPSDPQGVQHGWGDLHLRPRDMAKIGYLWLHGGSWEGRQILPAAWLADAVQGHSHPGWTAGQEYGYGIWVYPDRNPRVFEGLGRGGQRISVVPAANLVVVFTGGGFEPGDVGTFIGRAIKSDRALPSDSAGEVRLAAAVRAAAQPVGAGSTSALPRTAGVVSGRTFTFEANPIELRSLALSFAGGAEATVRLVQGGRVDSLRPVGLDGVPRVSPDGRFGLPVAVSGAWEGDSTFVLDFDELGNINDFHLRLTFSGDDVVVEVTERTGLLMATRFHGRAGS